MLPVPLAPYVTCGVVYPHLDAVQLAQQTFQAVLRVSDVEPRISLVSTYNVTLATVAKRAWDFYLQTPIPKGPLPECEAARREIALAFQELPHADPTKDSPWDVIAQAGAKVVQRSFIAGNAVDWISKPQYIRREHSPLVSGQIGFIGLDPGSLQVTKEIILLHIRETELRELQRLHLQAFLAGQEPFARELLGSSPPEGSSGSQWAGPGYSERYGDD